MLLIENLWVRYRTSPQTWVLKNINLEACRGELVVVAGASGCGKSTLAQTIMGLIPAFVPADIKGKIIVNEESIDHIKREQLIRKIGYVPQYPADFTTSLLVSEEIAFPLENLAFPQQEIQKRISKVLRELNIEHLAERLMTEISSGELQRVALATALAIRPPLLILDEPMARIDPKSEVVLSETLQGLAKQGHLVIAFEHRLDYLLSVADRLIVLEKGEVIANDSPRKAMDKLVGVDLPEISRIRGISEDRRPLNLMEAEKCLLEMIANNDAFRINT